MSSTVYSSMTRRHFQAIADAIRTIDGVNLRTMVVDKLIPVLGSFNSAFNATTFRTACNVPQPPMGVAGSGGIRFIPAASSIHPAFVGAANPVPNEVPVASNSAFSGGWTNEQVRSILGLDRPTPTPDEGGGGNW